MYLKICTVRVALNIDTNSNKFFHQIRIPIIRKMIGLTIVTTPVINFWYTSTNTKPITTPVTTSIITTIVIK